MFDAFRQGVADAREAAIDKKVKKALKKQQGPYITVQVNGTRERDDFLARGWEVVTQDMSERGQWVRIYLMRAPRDRALAHLDMRHLMR